MNTFPPPSHLSILPPCHLTTFNSPPSPPLGFNTFISSPPHLGTLLQVQVLVVARGITPRNPISLGMGNAFCFAVRNVAFAPISTLNFLERDRLHMWIIDQVLGAERKPCVGSLLRDFNSLRFWCFEAKRVIPCLCYAKFVILDLSLL